MRYAGDDLNLLCSKWQHLGSVEPAAVEPLDGQWTEGPAWFGGHEPKQLREPTGEDARKPAPVLPQCGDEPWWQEGSVLSKEGKEQLVEEVGNALGLMTSVAELLGQIREGTSGLLGKRAPCFGWL